MRRPYIEFDAPWDDIEDENLQEYMGEDAETLRIPAKYEVCGRCRGTGTHDHPAFENGFTRDDDFVDDDFIEEYMSGTYDVECSECQGERVVAVPDPDRAPPALLKIYNDMQQALWELQAEEAAERRMGA